MPGRATIRHGLDELMILDPVMTGRQTEALWCQHSLFEHTFETCD